MTTVSQTAAEKMLADLAEEFAANDFDPETEITAGIAASVWGVAIDTARNRLNAKIAAGEYQRREVVYQGCKQAAYRPVE